MRKGWTMALGIGVALATASHGRARTQDMVGPTNIATMDGKSLIQLVVSHEDEASRHRGHYLYLSVERSDRTGGHEWTEWVAETQQGKVKFLVAEDGKPLTGDRLAKERARIEDEGAHPDAFQREEASKMQDEQHARQMMILLPKAFLFDPPQSDGQYIRIKYRPNPDYQPASLEERVLHGMTGLVTVDQKMARTHSLEGHMPADVSIGFGILATIKAGSNFSTTREHLDGWDWKTETVHTDINGKAMFLKTVARKEDAKHSDFRRIPDNISVADAVKMVEEQGERGEMMSAK